MVQPLRSSLKQRADHDHAMLGGGLRQPLARRTRDRFGPIEMGVVFALTRIQAGEQLLQTDDVRALPGRLSDPLHGSVEIGLFVR